MDGQKSIHWMKMPNLYKVARTIADKADAFFSVYLCGEIKLSLGLIDYTLPYLRNYGLMHRNYFFIDKFHHNEEEKKDILQAALTKKKSRELIDMGRKYNESQKGGLP
jgi:hypothetical protein